MRNEIPAQSRFGAGLAAINFAILFNIPFAVLGAIYDYPQILRHPAGEALDKFAAGGTLLILTWYLFGFTALLLTPLSIAISITPRRMLASPALAIGAALAGTAASITQAIGLFRWVFVVPSLAAAHTANAASTEASFALLNAWGGVTIGEHMGQWFTALFLLLSALLQGKEGWVVSCIIACIAAVFIAVGTGEGLAIALGQDGSPFAIATLIGFVGLTLWLIVTGINLIRTRG